MTAAYPMNPHLAQRLRIETRTLYRLDHPSDLARRCGELFQKSQYEEGIKIAQSVDDYETNAIAQCQVGLGYAYLRQYEVARRLLTAGIQLSTSPQVQASYTAMIGTTFLEEQALERAEAMYRQALHIDPANVGGALGSLAVACHHKDSKAMSRALQKLIEQHPDWSTNQSIVSTLRHDRLFRFLRDSAEVFESICTRPPQHLSRPSGVSEDSLGRFEKLETMVQELKETVHDLTTMVQELRETMPSLTTMVQELKETVPSLKTREPKVGEPRRLQGQSHARWTCHTPFIGSMTLATGAGVALDEY